ncbi:thymidine phosphorylase [Allorhizobium sp. BGMRC 0089]|uniref:thymidine phosphorylase n=1 Tax=Allorhizobium sonneratiae TaxID=2934936 RepID=UPI002033FF23|nr:thymidine phosphorylase [Allorhizobium sonneratiae]MCM2291690.1 thymidine phosphorylase [Allorhizobium sonneratiae]
MLPQEIIRKKRDGLILSADEIAGFIRALAEDRLSEGQIAAFAMAVYLRGMSDAETVALTLAMRDSGTVLTWPGVERPIADKHSTGGVGDGVSLILAPVAAACGLAVPMISGRGLGHTGGTLDKLESIPGYNIAPDAEHLRALVRSVGAAIIGQTADLAPADKRLYAVRDVTATVESVPLITASILSKKLAAGLESLVMDVKLGNGAFMTDLAEARVLAASLVAVGNGAGMKTSALITDMNAPLSNVAGNALEVAYALSILRREVKDSRLEKVTLALVAEMLVNAGVEHDYDQALARSRQALDSGTAADLFARMVHGLGGPADFLERAGHYLPHAPVILPVVADESGFLADVATRDLGLAVIGLGGGRLRPDDAIDHAVGLSDLLPLGSAVKAGDVLARVHARDASSGERAVRDVLAAYHIAATAADARDHILEHIR